MQVEQGPRFCVQCLNEGPLLLIHALFHSRRTGALLGGLGYEVTSQDSGVYDRQDGIGCVHNVLEMVGAVAVALKSLCGWGVGVMGLGWCVGWRCSARNPVVFATNM